MAAFTITTMQALGAVGFEGFAIFPGESPTGAAEGHGPPRRFGHLAPEFPGMDAVANRAACIGGADAGLRPQRVDAADLSAADGLPSRARS